MNAVKFAEEARLCEDKEDYRTKMNERAAGTWGEGLLEKDKQMEEVDKNLLVPFTQ